MLGATEVVRAGRPVDLGTRKQRGLVAAEYMTPGVGARPTLFGTTFKDGPPNSGTYALHAWVWEHNPAGMFADFNPNVSCAATDGPAAAEHVHH